MFEFEIVMLNSRGALCCDDAMSQIMEPPPQLVKQEQLNLITTEW